MKVETQLSIMKQENQLKAQEEDEMQ